MHYAADCGRRVASVIHPFRVASMAMGYASGAKASKVYVFSAAPHTTFQVRRNHLPPDTVTSTTLGSLHLETATSWGALIAAFDARVTGCRRRRVARRDRFQWPNGRGAPIGRLGRSRRTRPSSRALRDARAAPRTGYGAVSGRGPINRSDS